MRKFLKFLPWILALIFFFLFFYRLQSSNKEVTTSTGSITPQVEYLGSTSAIPQDSSTYKVTRVIDGDTIEIEKDGKRIKVRYIGIDAPETGDCFGNETTQANKNLVEGKGVKIEYDVQRQDKYGRDLAYVYVGNTMVNQKLIEEGYAKLLTIPPDIKYVERFKATQKTARDKKLGLWGDIVCNSSPNSGLNPTFKVDSEVKGVQSDCLIKGNINSKKEKIYHMPGQRYYEKTQIDEASGERWFCLESEAEQAGWRKSKI